MLSPAAFQALKDRVDLEFDPAHRAAPGRDGKPSANAEQFGIEDPVKLRLHIKNVPKLIVKVFELNPRNHYLEHGDELSTDVNLDGLVANHERTVEYDDAPARRMTRDFEFPEIENRRGRVGGRIHRRRSQQPCGDPQGAARGADPDRVARRDGHRARRVPRSGGRCRRVVRRSQGRVRHGRPGARPVLDRSRKPDAGDRGRFGLCLVVELFASLGGVRSSARASTWTAKRSAPGPVRRSRCARC